MSSSLLRLSIQADEGRPVDLVLPATPPTGELLPTVVDLVGVGPGAWHLRRLDGTVLDDSISLRDNVIDSGSLLILTAAPLPPPPRREPDPFEVTAGPVTDAAPDIPLVPLVFCWSVVLSAVLICARGGTSIGAVAAAIGCAGAVFAMVRSAHRVSPLLPGVAILLGATAGFLAVPSKPSAPNVLLSAATAAAVAWLLVRLHPRTMALGAAVISLCIPVALAAAAAVAHPVASTTIGAGLICVAWTVLTLAPRISLLGSGLTPDTAGPQRVARARRTLTGLVLGSAGAVVVGLAALGFDPRPRAAALAAGSVLSVLLLLRSNTFRRPELQWPLATSGFLCATATLINFARTFPTWTPWLSLGLLTVGLAALRADLPAVRWAMTRVDPVLSLTLVPTVLWAADAYATVRGR